MDAGRVATLLSIVTQTTGIVTLSGIHTAALAELAEINDQENTQIAVTLASAAEAEPTPQDVVNAKADAANTIAIQPLPPQPAGVI